MGKSEQKVSVQELSEILSRQADVPKKFSERFLRELIDVIAEYLEKDGIVKVKGLGTFKLLWVDGRRSVDVTTGNEIVLPAHYKVSFVPEQTVKNSVNEPYAHLSTVVTELPEDLAARQKHDVEEPSAEVEPAVSGEEINSARNTLSDIPQPVTTAVEEPVVRQQPVKDDADMNNSSDSENNRGGKSKSVLALTVFAVVAAAVAVLWNVCDFSFSAVEDGDYYAAEAMNDKESEIQELVENENGPLYDLALSDSIIGSDTLSEPADLIVQEEIPVIDPFDSYTKEVAMNAPTRETVTVINGSRLTMVAYRAFGRKEFWVYVYDANRDKLKNPASIEKGMVLKIPELDSVLVDPNSKKALDKALELARQY